MLDALRWALSGSRARRVPIILGMAILLVFTGVLSAEAEAADRDVARSLRDRDLAILLPTDDPVMRIGLGEAGFGRSWYRSLELAFGGTTVGPALEVENSYEDWRLVAVRIVPCQSLFDRPHDLAGRLCWPEVRLVLQPIVSGVEAAGRIWPHFADDRAVHLTYDYVAEGRSVPRELRDGLKSALGQPGIGGGGLSARLADDLSRFESERDVNTLDLVRRAVALRLPGVRDNDVVGVDMRPEYALGETERREFTRRMRGLLSAVRNTSPLPREVTAFSLPEGREPALLDDWVFLRFVAPATESLQAAPIEVRSARDGSVLASVPGAPGLRVTMARDDDAIYEALEQRAGTPAEDQFRKNMILFVPDIQANRDRIADGQQVRVANTTCGSCHKLGKLRFDLHSLSYLQGEPITISPRVRRDVALDLSWLAAWNP